MRLIKSKRLDPHNVVRVYHDPDRWIQNLSDLSELLSFDEEYTFTPHSHATEKNFFDHAMLRPGSTSLMRSVFVVRERPERISLMIDLRGMQDEHIPTGEEHRIGVVWVPSRKMRLAGLDPDHYPTAAAVAIREVKHWQDHWNGDTFRMVLESDDPDRVACAQWDLDDIHDIHDAALERQLLRLWPEFASPEFETGARSSTWEWATT